MTEQNDIVVDDSAQAEQPTSAAEQPTTADTIAASGSSDSAERRPERASDTVATDDSAHADSEHAEHAESSATGTDGAGTSGASGPLETSDSSAPAVDEAEPSRRRPAKQADLEREGEVAADFLETLLDIADLDGDIDVDVDGDRAAVSIVDSEEGRVPRRLVGQDGKVLEALQELTRLAVQSATGERSRLMLDVAGHRAERRSSLVEVARTVIEQVKASGEKAALEPMTAFERKVVHDEVLAAGLSSESDGVEPRRFVVVLPA